MRHQRIHQRTPDDQGTDEVDGAREDSAVDEEDLRRSSGSESETTPAENQTSNTENSNYPEEAVGMVDDTGVKENKESSTEASKELQTKEPELDSKAPEPKDAADPSLEDHQGAADKPVV